MTKPFKLVRTTLVGEYATRVEAVAALARQPKPASHVKFVVIRTGGENAEIRGGLRVQRESKTQPVGSAGKKTGAKVAKRTTQRGRR